MPANYRPLYTRPTFVDESLFGTPNETAVKMSRSMPASVRNGVTVMGAQELSNIGFRAKSKGGETGLAHQRRLERDRLQKLSDERKAKWPNTIEAARAAKEKQRKAKLDAEEALRQQIDAEEEALNVEKRRLAIERANKMLYHGTDRVKELHSKLLLADVMQERECQIELKKKLKQRQLVQDELWYQKQQDAIRRMDAEEDLRDREEEEKRVLVAKVREEQVQQQRNMHASRVAMTKREGEIMRNAAAEELKVEARQREEAKEEEQRLRAEFVEANNALMAKREEVQRLADIEEAAMLEYATGKEKDLLARRDREEERFRARQAWRQSLIDKQVAALTDMNAAQNARLENQAREVEAKAQDARRRLDEKKKNELLVTHMSRQQQMRWKREKDEQERQDQLHFAGELQKLNASLREEEAQTIRDRFEKAKVRDRFLLQQMDAKVKAREQEQLDDMYEAEHVRQWMGDDDAIFDQYAQMCLDEWVAQGKNPRPIETVLTKARSFAD